MTARPTSPTRRAALAAALLAVAVTAGSCGADHSTPDTGSADGATGEGAGARDVAETLPTAVSTLDVVGTEYVFDIDATAAGGTPIDLAAGATLPAGWTRVTFRNEGDEAHQVMFARLKDGVDLSQLAATAGGDSSGSAAIEFVDMIGGVSYIGPGQSIEAMVDLPEGIVMAMCYVPDGHGVAHALSGMTTMLTVGPAPTDAPPTDAASADAASAGSDGEPVQGTIEMTADGYEIPESVPTGWYHVVNRETGEDSTGLHELAILGLGRPVEESEVDAILADLAANATPDVPLVAFGGMGALSGGFDGYLHLDLDEGPYLAVDFMPDPGDPRPHLLDGYATLFEV